MNFQTFQVALFSYLSSLGLEGYLTSTEDKKGVYVNFLNIQQEKTKTDQDRYKYSIKLTFFNDDNLSEVQELAQRVIEEGESGIDGLMNGYRVALYNSDGLSVNIDEIEGAPYYGVSLNLEITVEKE